MRVVVLTTHTNNTPMLYSALSKTREVYSFIYDRMLSFGNLPGMINQLNPDWVLYIGAIPECHGLPVPSIQDLKAIPYKKVHLCCDGSDDAWWRLLEDYYKHTVFDLQINIDGMATGPLARHGLTTIAPIDSSLFDEPYPWSERGRFAGFPGLMMGGERGETLRTLVNRNLVDHRQRDDQNNSADYINWLKDCKVIWNHPETGGMKSQHVKARVIEAALAGCLVLEKEGSPLSQWFDPGVDYMAWYDVDNVAGCLNYIRNHQREAEVMAEKMRIKLLTKYSVDKFWNDVEKMIGVRAECAA